MFYIYVGGLFGKRKCDSRRGIRMGMNVRKTDEILMKMSQCSPLFCKIDSCKMSAKAIVMLVRALMSKWRELMFVKLIWALMSLS